MIILEIKDALLRVFYIPSDGIIPREEEVYKIYMIFILMSL